MSWVLKWNGFLHTNMPIAQKMTYWWLGSPSISRMTPFSDSFWAVYLNVCFLNSPGPFHMTAFANTTTLYVCMCCICECVLILLV